MYGGGVCFSLGRCCCYIHGCALFLDVKFVVKSKNIFVENEF